MDNFLDIPLNEANKCDPMHFSISVREYLHKYE